MVVKIVTHSSELPLLPFESFFHGSALFKMIEHTPRMSPCMAIAYDDEGKIVAHLFASLRRIRTKLGFYYFKRARIYGEGVYKPDVGFAEKHLVFDEMVNALMAYLLEHRYFHVEISDITKKTFGYRTLRNHRFVPIPWMQIHHSLHSKTPEERIFDKAKANVDSAYSSGVITRQAETMAEVHALYKLVKAYYRLRKQRYIPHEQLFNELALSDNAHIYVTLYKDKIIGGSVVVDAGKESMIWFDVAMRKRYKRLHPHDVTIWYAIKEAHRQGQNHIHILNIGLPFSNSPYRDFMLSFGGKLISSYRWFRYSNRLINRFMFWYYQM